MAKELTNLMVDAAAGRLSDYSAADINAKIRAQFHAVLGTNDESSPKEIRKAVRRHKAEIYDLIEETIERLVETNYLDSEFFNRFVEVRNVAAGDMNSFFVEGASIVTTAEFSGGHHDIERQRFIGGQTYSVKTSWYGMKVYEEFELFMAGRIDWARYVNKLYEGMDNTINQMVLTSFTTIETTIPPRFSTSGTVTEAIAAELVDKVEAASGRPAIIVGSRAAISKLNTLTPAGLFSNEMKQERNTIGVVGVFLGTDVLRIPQAIAKGTDNLIVPDDKLYVIPMTDNKPIKLVQEGDTIYNESTDNAVRRDMTIEAELQTKMGVATVASADYGVITFA